MDPIIEVTRASYEGSASGYADSTWDYESYPGLYAEAFEFSESVRLKGPIMDLGCGAGRDATFFNSRGHRVMAADISEAMLHEARRRITSVERSQIEFTCLDLRQLPFKGGSFNGVWASGSLLHISRDDMLPTLRQIVRVLKRDGIATLSMKRGTTEGWERLGAVSGSRWFTYVEPEDFSGLMRQAGFKSVVCQSSGRGAWFLATGTSPKEEDCGP
ncbi:class I SAM-dependent methyltransferase [Streptomyces sp. SID13666]|nr:class I SAM-dependent methyltransferase [Streptomyces sp. SID13666]NEA74525.1 class I SAM-dependent methyltransferase [Streptomyces sp. SID13588]